MAYDIIAEHYKKYKCNVITFHFTPCDINNPFNLIMTKFLICIFAQDSQAYQEGCVQPHRLLMLESNNFFIMLLGGTSLIEPSTQLGYIPSAPYSG